jgi:CBS domain containing-hemolysin-like protein
MFEPTMDDPASLFLLFEGVPPETSSPLFWSVLGIGLVILLVLLNGFFVCAEFAFVAVRRSRIEALANEGKAGARRLLGVLDNMTAYLSAAQVGVTLASLGLGWVGEPAIASLLEEPLSVFSDPVRHTVAFLIAFVLISSLHIVAGEQAPKLFGLALAERVAIGTALPMQIFYTALKHPIHALDWASARIVNLFGIQATSEHASIYTEDEIRQLINVSEESGHLNKEERQLLHQVFEFSETTVREAMIPRTEALAIPYGCSLHEIAEAFHEHGYSRLPVYRGSLDDIVGVIHSKDIMSYLLRPEAFDLDQIIQKPVYVVDTARLEDVLRQMQKEKFHFGFVVDEHGGVEGIITLEDLLEEIVGDISDEHDEEVNEQIMPQPDGSVLMDGSVAVRDINRRLGLNLPISEGYTTVAGFLMAEAGELLSPGESVSFNGHTFKVEKVDKRRILQVRMVNTPSHA